LRIVLGADALVCEWLAKTQGLEVPQHPRLILAIADGDQLVGAFVIVWHHNRTAELSIYGTVSQETVKQMFRTVFEQCEVYRLEVRTEKSNKAIRRAAPKCGFSFEHTARHYYGPNRHAYVYSMIPEQCRWLKRHGHPLLVS
jgi:RimJ/RimL family protein N-acetyltransferase